MNARVPWNAQPRERFVDDRGAWNAAMGKVNPRPVLWDGSSGEPIPAEEPRGSRCQRFAAWWKSR